MLKSALRQCYSILKTLSLIALLYFGFPASSYASANSGLPDSAHKVMIAVFVAGAIILISFAIFVYRTSKKNRRS
ncbi:MAG: hypothetical protein K0Q81_891 [Paenibacillus sp.]|nr:hypothetical protein [Paenibacillus sp.]